MIDGSECFELDEDGTPIYGWGATRARSELGLSNHSCYSTHHLRRSPPTRNVRRGPPGKVDVKASLDLHGSKETQRARCLVSLESRIMLLYSDIRQKALVRMHLDELFKINVTDEIAFHMPPTLREIEAWEQTNCSQNGPSLSSLKADMKGGVGSDWNCAWMQLAAKSLCHRSRDGEFGDAINERVSFWFNLIKARFTRLIVRWKAQRTKRKLDGSIETREEARTRLADSERLNAKRKRRRQRRCSVRFLACNLDTNKS
jgi:hypothetical protein